MNLRICRIDAIVRAENTISCQATSMKLELLFRKNEDRIRRISDIMILQKDAYLVAVHVLIYCLLRLHYKSRRASRGGGGIHPLPSK